MNIDPITTPREDNAIGFSSTPIKGHQPPVPSCQNEPKDRGVTPIPHESLSPSEGDMGKLGEQDLLKPSVKEYANMLDNPKVKPTQTLFSRVIASLYYIMTWLMPWKYFSHKGVGPQRSFQSTPNPPCKPSFMRQCLNRVHKFTGCM